jgi:hypothetical protein
VTAIASADEGVAWAQRRLKAKNTLTLSDADLIEQAFREKMSSFEELDANSNARGAEQTGQCDDKAPNSQNKPPRENGTRHDESPSLNR